MAGPGEPGVGICTAGFRFVWGSRGAGGGAGDEDGCRTDGDTRNEELGADSLGVRLPRVRRVLRVPVGTTGAVRQ